MFIATDICVIFGLNFSGKTTFAKYLASTLDKNFIYIDFIHTPYDIIDNIYETNKNNKHVIIFDNYIEIKTNMRRMNLFKHQRQFTLIFVLNYIEKTIMNISDVIYIAKNTEQYYIDIYFNLISKYYTNKNNFITKMNKLRNFGFICIDKDNKNKFEEELIKLPQ